MQLGYNSKGKKIVYKISKLKKKVATKFLNENNSGT